MTRTLLALVASASGAAAFADVIDVPADFATIQGAIDAAAPGDEIVVAAGTYLERIDFTGKAVTVRSADGPSATTIDGGGTGTVVSCVSGEGPDTVLKGFTVTGGLTAGSGGGMVVQGASPTVVGCIFSGNAAGLGGGMSNQDAHPTITSCAFVGNSAGSSGGAVHNGGLTGSHPVLANCLFRSNSAEVGAAMFNQVSSPALINCTLGSNTAGVLAGGIFNDSSSPALVNCILWGNTPDQVFNVASTPSVTWSDVQGGTPGLGNINQDPRFVDAPGGNLRLDRFSPCVDAANNAALPADSVDLDGDGDAEEPVPVDLDGAPRFFDDAGVADNGASPTGPPLADMGAFERQETSIPAVLDVGPGDSIQAAIDSAGNGDEIVVAPGTYLEAINFGGKAVTLRSSGGPALTVIDAAGTGGSAVTCTTGEGPGTVLEGFTITGGTGTFDGTRLVGGGMNNLLSSPTVTDCIFTGNTAGVGGGMYNLLSSPAVTGCTLAGNSAGVGGGMHNSNSSPVITGSSFLGNTATVGAGIYNEFSPAVVSGCTFEGNAATPGGGGGVFNGFFSASRLLDCTFSANTALDWLGGGVLNALSNLTVHNCRFSGNSARQGGAVNIDGSTVAFFGCAFTGNEATEVGGGGLFGESASIQVINGTFAGNTAPAGDAGDAIELLGGTATLANSIVWNDSIEAGGGATLTATFSDIQGGSPGTGNIDQDPQFVDEAGGDLRLSAGSPCIDAADNAAVPPDAGDLDDDGDATEPVPLDLDGDPRFVDDPRTADTGNPGAGGPVVDMGSHEFQLPPPCPADLDGDGGVGITDLLALLGAWDTDPGGPPDLDGDGSVGITDLLALLAAWGACA